jgi:hypothetical protein
MKNNPQIMLLVNREIGIDVNADNTECLLSVYAMWITTEASHRCPDCCWLCLSSYSIAVMTYSDIFMHFTPLIPSYILRQPTQDLTYRQIYPQFQQTVPNIQNLWAYGICPSSGVLID